MIAFQAIDAGVSAETIKAITTEPAAYSLTPSNNGFTKSEAAESGGLVVVGSADGRTPSSSGGTSSGRRRIPAAFPAGNRGQNRRTPLSRSVWRFESGHEAQPRPLLRIAHWPQRPW